MKRREQPARDLAVALFEAREVRRLARALGVGRVDQDRERAAAGIDLHEVHAIAHEQVRCGRRRDALQAVARRVRKRHEVGGANATRRAAGEDAITQLATGASHFLEPRPAAAHAPRIVELREPHEICHSLDGISPGITCDFSRLENHSPPTHGDRWCPGRCESLSWRISMIRASCLRSCSHSKVMR